MAIAATDRRSVRFGNICAKLLILFACGSTVWVAISLLSRDHNGMIRARHFPIQKLDTFILFLILVSVFQTLLDSFSKYLFSDFYDESLDILYVLMIRNRHNTLSCAEHWGLA